MSLPHALTGLTPREAITDALYRAIQAFDDNDFPLLESSMMANVTVNFHDKVLEGLPEVKATLFDPVGPLDTTHTISNIRISLEPGATTAGLTAVALAQHIAPGQGLVPDANNYLAASRYSLDMVKEESEGGLWKVQRFSMKIIWTQGDRSVMTTAKPAA